MPINWDHEGMLHIAPDLELEQFFRNFLDGRDGVFSIQRITNGGIIGNRDGHREFLSNVDLHVLLTLIDCLDAEDQDSIDGREYLDDRGEVVGPPRDVEVEE